jgi:hypothetical protein
MDTTNVVPVIFNAYIYFSFLAGQDDATSGHLLLWECVQVPLKPSGPWVFDTSDRLDF